MLKSFFVLAIRNLFKNGAYSIINILGLSVGLAAFILISLFVNYETSWDTFHKDYERIFRVEQKIKLANSTVVWNNLPAPTSVELENRYPEVEEAIAIREVWGEYLSTSKERTFYERRGYYANPDVFNLFTINFISGNKENALNEPMKIVLTESLAKKLFPNSEAMGQSILVDSKRTYQVSAIIEDFPFNTNIRASYFTSFSTYVSNGNRDFFDYWDLNDVHIFVKLKENVKSKEFENKIKYLFDEFLVDREDELKLKPIRIIKLLQSDGSGYWIVVSLYGIVGLFTLLLAAMNFVNLTTAYSLNRAKEIGIKKVLGCKRKGLIQQFLGESLIIVFISLLIAFTITEAALPVFSRVVSLPLDLKYIEDWSFTLFIIGIAVLTGILSGLYPSLVLSSLSPMLILKSKFFGNDRIKKLSMRKGLIVFQVVMAIVFVMFALSILSQFNYLKNKNMGFDKQNLILSKIQETDKVKINEFSVLRNELLQFAGVEEVSLSFTLPFRGSWGRTINWEGSQAGEQINCRFNRASTTFIPTLKLELIAGRNFDEKFVSDSSSCIVNQAFVNAVGWDYQDAVGKRLWDNKYTIIGVMKDFHEQSPVTKIKPYLLIYHPGYLTGTKKILIRVKDISDSDVSGFIKTKLEEFFPESNFEVRPYDENLDDGTQKVFLGLAKTFGFFSVVSIVIAIIGLFAMISFNVKRKVKEIGIRKVLGASPMQIYAKLAKEYLVLILIANLIAIPLGIFSGNADPSYYKQHISVDQIIYISILSFVITLLTITIQVIKSARSNPVESLRYE